MSKRKYRFKKEFQDAVIHLPRHRFTLHKGNITDKKVEFLLGKFGGRYDHNFEEVPEQDKASAKDRAEAVKAADSIDKVNSLIENETAKSVLQAAEKRKSELSETE